MSVTSTIARPASRSLWNSAVTSYYLLAFATAILVLLGLAVVLSSSSIYSIRQQGGNPYTLFTVQLAALAVGVVALVLGSRMPVKWWKRIGPLVLLAAFALLALTMVVGISSGGNRNWIPLGPVTIQPSEIAKLGLALYLGSVLGMFRTKLTNLRAIMLPGGLVTLAVLGFVLAGGDMGTAIILVLVAVAAFWVAGMPLRFFGLIAVALSVGAVILLFAAESRVARLTAFLSPDCDPTDACYQQTHGTWALATGGLWGLGPGMSREKWGYLPAADNDFIFAIVGEEFGLFGTLLVLFAFGMIAVAVNRIVQRHPDPFVKISAAALGAWLVGQALINMGVVLELLPVAGVPLPLISSGGTSLVMSLAAIGVLMAYARSEPGAPEAFSARPSVVRKSIAVLSGGRIG